MATKTATKKTAKGKHKLNAVDKAKVKGLFQQIREIGKASKAKKKK